jgi:ADP-heptose:LPS heptosyltransferase
VPPLFDHDEPRSVALVRARVGLGDLLCTVPALRALRARLPDARIVLVTFEEVRGIVERLEPAVELLPFPGWPGIPERPPDEAALPAFLEAARAEGFDLALQAYGANPAANALTAALGARRTGGFFLPGTLPERPDLTTHLPYPLHEHEVRRHLRLVEHLGAPPAGEALAFPLRAGDLAQAAALRPAGPYACVHPGATSSSRRWPARSFAAVADRLAGEGLEIVLSGVPGEEARTRAVARRASAATRPSCATRRCSSPTTRAPRTWPPRSASRAPRSSCRATPCAGPTRTRATPWPGSRSSAPRATTSTARSTTAARPAWGRRPSSPRPARRWRRRVPRPESPGGAPPWPRSSSSPT